MIDGTRSDLYDMTFGVTKESTTGASARLRVETDLLRQRPGPVLLNPQSRPAVTLGLNQPLLEGAGRDVNRVPIVLARIDTERSFFQLKDGLQQMVRQVIQAYWDLIAARTSLWAVEQQLEQSEFAVQLETARKQTGISTQGQLAQAQFALANFQANRIAAKGLVLNAEAALRAILAIPPSGPDELVPTTPPRKEGLEFDWQSIVDLSERNRPDLIELKLVLEADYQQLLLSAQPDTPTSGRRFVLPLEWVGRRDSDRGRSTHLTRARSLTGRWASISPSRWDFAVRAALRQQELILARDRANLDLAMLQVVHELASALRRLDQDYQQYRAYTETRRAATDNLRQQFAGFRTGRLEFINVLEAITNWGNSVRSEAQSLTQYNADLATLESLTGTILEAHGIRLYEERYGSIGPLGLLGHEACYPRILRPQSEADRYEQGEEPAESAFDLTTPDFLLRDDRERLRERFRQQFPEDLPSPSDREEPILRRLPGE